MTVEKLIAKGPPDVAELHALIREAAPSLEPTVLGSMLAYGPYRYRYASGREGNAARVMIAFRKTGISLYVTSVDKKGYLTEQAKAKLGKAVIGRSCIRFKKLADLDRKALRALLARAARVPGGGEIL